MVLSKETRRNNGALINELLFNSLYRNGAQVNMPGIRKGIQLARSGGVFNNTVTPASFMYAFCPGIKPLDKIKIYFIEWQRGAAVI